MLTVLLKIGAALCALMFATLLTCLLLLPATASMGGSSMPTDYVERLDDLVETPAKNGWSPGAEAKHQSHQKPAEVCNTLRLVSREHHSDMPTWRAHTLGHQFHEEWRDPGWT